MESDQCFETLDSNQMLPHQRILGQDIWDQEFDEIERERSTRYAVHQMKIVYTMTRRVELVSGMLRWLRDEVF